MKKTELLGVYQVCATGPETESFPQKEPNQTRPTTPISTQAEETESCNKDENYEPCSKKVKEKPSKVSARVASQTAFLEMLTAQQRETQERQFENEQRMQLQLQDFEERREENRKRFKAELRQKEEGSRRRMDERIEFQEQISQRNQLF